jgi:hypothetical protein
MRSIAPRILALAASLLFMTALAPGALAETTPGSHPTGTLLATSMHVVRFDAAVAAEHGFSIITRNGIQMSVPAGQTDGPPKNTVGGPCGTSYIYLTGSILQYEYYTGFTVIAPAVEFGWSVNIVGPNFYDRTGNWGGVLKSARSWRAPGTGEYDIPVDDSGYYDGAVVSAASFAILDNGEVCYSGGPSSRTYVNYP